MDRETRIRETFLAPVGAALLARDTQIIERDGWYQTITPSSGSTSGNEVVWSRLADTDADAVIAATIAQYAAHALPFKWCTGPLTAPVNFGATLERHGFVGWGVRGMAIAPAAFVAPVPADVEVEPVTDATWDDYVTALQRGWGPDLALRDLRAWRDDHDRARATGRFHYFLARIDGEPVGTAAYITKPRSAYLVGGNVVPSQRGRGVYRALIAERLRRIAAHGLTLATTQAREATSAPILEKLGFESLYAAPVYHRETPRTREA